MKHPLLAVSLGPALAVVMAACGGPDASPPAQAAAPRPVQVSAENVTRVAGGAIVTGPLLSGELGAERQATVRAELGGSMLQVAVQEGQAVRRGAILGRIDAATLDEARRSAESAVRAAERQLDVARREAERTEQLVKAGALARRDLDLAQSAVATAEAQLDDARARVVTARKQQQDAVVVAPLGGIVSDRAVNTGDVVTPGTELFTILDPASMRLEASVPSDQIGRITVGLPVRFTVRGYEREFEGRIERISPAADPVTRQVALFVSVPNTEGQLVAGLYAEGRVVVERASGLVVDESAVDFGNGEQSPSVLRVANGVTERVPVRLGLRDPLTERVQVVSGLREGDIVLRGSAQGLPPGTPVALDAAAVR